MIKNSFSGVVLGVILFLLSFVVLYWNEGRADMSDVAKRAVVIQANGVQANTAYEDQLVSASGTVTADPRIGDDLYLEPGPYLVVERKVDVYAWVEKSETVTTTRSDGTETSETNYTYVMEWTSTPPDSDEFHEPEGHANVPASISENTTTATTAMVEQYSFSPEVIDVPELSKLVLKSDNVTLTQNAELANDTYIYVRNSSTGTYQAPQLGDVRISYNVLKVPFEGTVFGKLEGTTIKPYVTKKNDTLYRVFTGSHDEAIATLHREYTTALWAFRVLGFLMMWFGLAMLFGPISMVIDFVPVLGTLGRAVIGLVTFAVAFVLSLVTIVVSAILHNIFAVLVVVAVILAGVIGSGVAAKKKQLAHGSNEPMKG